MSTSPEPFNHPEFIEYPKFDEFRWTLQPANSTIVPGEFVFNYTSTDGETLKEIANSRGLISRVLVKDNLQIVETVIPQKIVTTINEKIVKTEIVSLSQHEEVWYVMVHGKSEPNAIRRTMKGVLSSDDEDPAVVIREFSPSIIERQEFWNQGVLKKIRIVKDKMMILSEENFQDGKSIGITRTDPWYWTKNAIALWERGLSKASVVAPPVSYEIPAALPETPKKVEIITANRAREMRIETIDDITSRFNDAIEAAIAKRKNIIHVFEVGDSEVSKEFQALLEKSGYKVSYYEALRAFSVSW